MKMPYSRDCVVRFLVSDLMRGVIFPYGNTGWTSSEGATRKDTDVNAWLIYIGFS